MLSLPLYVILLLVMAVPAALAGAAELEDLMKKMEQDVLDLASEVEDLYTSRCSFALDDCDRSNYEHCLSTLPNPTCPASDEFIIEACNGCGALFDYTVSTVHLPKEVADGENGNPTDVQAIESICYSRQLDQWFQNKHATDVSYWASFDAESPQIHFGARDGSFRIFPGRRRANCSDYDPRERPWYIAASSGPKNIILVLDTSGSMAGQRLALLKEAAKRVVSTLTVGDRIAIVRFDSTATSITDPNGRMFIASKANIQTLLDEIDRFEASGQTNFYDAFETAFAVMKRTIDEELHVKCNSAILFLTDGEMSEQGNLTESDVISQVRNRLVETTNSTGKPVLLFTFSVENGSEDVHTFPKTLACSTEFGVWSKIIDARFIVESLESYYKLFALGIGQNSNADFVAWVEPYSFATGGVLGTTVSAPVYDRSKDPPIFLGVVGFDFTLAAMDKALGMEAGSQEVLDKVILASTANCPSLNLSICELESFRRQGAAGNDALCATANCTENDFVKIEPENCSSVSDYPQDLWNNIDSQGKDYEESVCCTVNETETVSQCLASDKASNNTSGEASNNTAVIAGVVGSMSGLLFIILAVAFVRWQKRRTAKSQFPHPSITPNAGTISPAVEQPGFIYVLPPPNNPAASAHQSQHPKNPAASAPAGEFYYDTIVDNTYDVTSISSNSTACQVSDVI